MPIQTRQDAIDALTAIALQGEGVPLMAGGVQPRDSSHFARFHKIFFDPATNTRFPDGKSPGMRWHPERNLVSNPNTTVPPPPDVKRDRELRARENQLAPGRITTPEALRWATLFDLPSRMLLTDIAHSLSIPATRNGQPTGRNELIKWAFHEMKLVLKRLAAERLPSLEQRAAAPDGPFAAAPFTLPYTLALPDRESDRWRLHLDLLL